MKVMWAHKGDASSPRFFSFQNEQTMSVQNTKTKKISSLFLCKFLKQLAHQFAILEPENNAFHINENFVF